MGDYVALRGSVEQILGTSPRFRLLQAARWQLPAAGGREPEDESGFYATSLSVKQYLHLQMYVRNHRVHLGVALELNIPSYWAGRARRKKTTG